jgi:hypothetical protein
MSEQPNLSLKQKILKTIQLISLIIWAVSLIALILSPFLGVSFIVSTAYGFNALVLLAMYLGIGYWWIYLPTLIYIIVFGIKNHGMKEYKQYNYKKFLICLASAIILVIIIIQLCNIVSNKVNQSKWYTRGYSDINVVTLPYSDNFTDLANTSTTLSYDDLFDFVGTQDNEDLINTILKYQGNYTTYSLIVSPVISGEITNYTVSNLEIKGDNTEARINTIYNSDNTDTKSLIILLIDSFSVDDYSNFTPTWTLENN